jgi:hypothetical protein
MGQPEGALHSPAAGSTSPKASSGRGRLWQYAFARLWQYASANFPLCSPGYAENTEIPKCHKKLITKGTKWALKGSPNGHKSSQRLPKGSPKVAKWVQVGPKGVSRGLKGGPKGSPGGPEGSPREPPGSKTSPRGAPGDRSWNLLLGVPEKDAKIWQSRFQDLSVQGEK